MADDEQDVENNSDAYTKDGTVDLHGRPFLRAKGGRWTACSFLIASELLERLAFFGVNSSLVIYLTNELHQDTVTSAKNVNNWMGSQLMLTILGACVSDAYLGGYWTTMLFSAIYCLGMLLLALTVSLPSLKPPPCNSSNAEKCDNPIKGFRIIIFYFALYITALGIGGRKANTSCLGANQFDVFEPSEQVQKLSFFNWWTFAMFSGALFSSIFLVYIQENISWSIGYALTTLAIGISTFIFIVGTPYYRHLMPSGSPFTRLVRVLVSAARKWRVSLPNDPRELHELELRHYLEERKTKINHTNTLRFLDKAAVKSSGSDSPWMLCSVTQVEETKQIMKLLPVFIVTLMPSVTLAQVTTLFVKQGVTLDRSIGPQFKIPPASFVSFFIISNLITIVIYERLLPSIKKHTKNPHGFALLQKIGIGSGMHVIIMIMAALTERWRLIIAKKHGLVYKDGIVSLTIFALLPQFALMGMAEVFVGTGKMEFFYEQAPEGLKSLGNSLFVSTIGIGNFFSSFILSTTAKVTRKGGGEGWIENNLNASHLDYYYGLLAVLNLINFVFFLIVAKYFVYNGEANMRVSDITGIDDQVNIEADIEIKEELNS